MTTVEQSRPRGVVSAQVIDARRIRWLVLGALVIGRTALSAYMINRPGLQYDESLFVNAATLRIPGMFIAHSIGGIPLMVFPYIGALKSWLYAPVFSLFGTSPTSIRLPVVLIASLALVLVYVAVRDLVNRPVAMLAFAALCFDNSIFWLTRDDVGPNALELFFKCAALACVARFVRGGGRSTRWVVLLLGALALGLFNKLNFIWTVNAAVLVSVLVLVHHRHAVRARVRAVGLWVGGLAVIYGCFAAYYLADHIGTSLTGGHGSALAFTWTQFSGGTALILDGTWFYNYALAPLGGRDVVQWLYLALFAAGAMASLLPGVTRNRAVAYMALATLSIALQNLITAQATAGWHYISIYPFVTVVAAYGVYALAATLLRRRLAIQIALACVATAVLAYDGTLLGTYYSDLSTRDPSFSAWSPAIYSLSRDVQRSDAHIFTADWGIANSLFALHPSRRYTELAFAFGTPTPGSAQQTRQLVASTPGPKLIVTHSATAQVFPQARTNLFKTLGSHLHFAGAIDGRSGKPVFDTYFYR